MAIARRWANRHIINIIYLCNAYINLYPFHKSMPYLYYLGLGAFDEAIEVMITNKNTNEKYFNRYISFWFFTF